MGHKAPQDGGCWYCHTDDGDMLFSTEFDTYVHMKCLEATVAENDPNDREAAIMAAELLPEKQSE